MDTMINTLVILRLCKPELAAAGATALSGSAYAFVSSDPGGFFRCFSRIMSCKVH